MEKKMEKTVTVYGVFVFEDSIFKTMDVYKTEDDAYGVFDKYKKELVDGSFDFEEWDELGGKALCCCMADLIVRVCGFDLPADWFDEEGNLVKPIYACAREEDDKYHQISDVVLLDSEEVVSAYIEDWFANMHNYFGHTIEEEGLVPPAEEVEQMEKIPFDHYIYSDYGRFGGCEFAIGVRVIETIQ